MNYLYSLSVHLRPGFFSFIFASAWWLSMDSLTFKRLLFFQARLVLYFFFPKAKIKIWNRKNCAERNYSLIPEILRRLFLLRKYIWYLFPSKEEYYFFLNRFQCRGDDFQKNLTHPYAFAIYFNLLPRIGFCSW